MELDNTNEFDQALIARAREAASRWDVRKDARDDRTKALGEGRLLDADSPSRLAMRVNRLVNKVRVSSRTRALPENPVLRQAVERHTPIVAEDLTRELVQEVVLGARNFLSIEFLERGIQTARRVGRILIRSGGSVRARGTGFIVAPGLVLTNHHVLKSKEQAAACQIEMDYEQNQFGQPVQPQAFDFQPERFFLNNPGLDFALVAVAPRGNRDGSLKEYGWLPLNAAQGKIAITAEDYLNIIQHPLGREKEVVLRNNRPLDLATSNEDEQQLGPFIHYEADTEKGSSGSPVFNDQWEVVALHHSGVPKRDADGNWLNKDGRVWHEGTQPVSEIAWIANEGTRVSSLIAELTSVRVLDHERSLLDALLSSQPSESPARTRPDESLDPSATQLGYHAVASPRRTAKREPGQRSDLSLGGAISFELPLQVVIRLGGKERIMKTVVPPAGDRDELLTEALTAVDYVDRDGYDRNFLGVNVPFPTMKSNTRFGGILKIPRPARPTDKFELRYHRFSVIMNKVRHLAYISACNVNFDPPSSVSRDEGTQSWRRDPRLDSNQQLGAPYYDDNDYDKGHLTRRDDAAWGSDKDDALAANWDTFHYTNAGPQHFLFNRSNDFTGAGLDLWGDLENHISAQGGQQRTRLTIFNGPIFGNNDKPLKDALVPLSYFKIVVWRDPNQTPGALGFVLDQNFLIEDLPEEAIDPGVFKIRQKRISRIQQDLDLNFGIVSQGDQMPLSDDDESLDDGVLLTSVNDIIIARTR